MPIKVPNNLPAVDILTKENVFVMTDTRAVTQDIRPLEILILNLMPTKIETETQLTRLLGNTPLQVQLELLQTSTHKASNVSQEHMIAFYKTFDQIKSRYYDGMIITGAPVELMDFEEVEYWDELCEIMEWSKDHVHNIFYICWGAQAGLYYHYGIKKELLPKKLSGVYSHTLEYKTGMLFRGFDDEFFVPHSRNTKVDEEAVFNHPDLRVISTSPEAGIFACKSQDDKHIFIMGHSEYDPDTLKKEYLRDLDAGINPEIPCNYFPDDDPNKDPRVIWRSCANLLYSNWLNYFVYQSTPFDLNAISSGVTPAHELVTEGFDLIVCKFGGTSLADSDKFNEVKSIIEKDPRRRYLVVSAPGKRFEDDIKVTDLLLEAASAASEAMRKEALNQVKNRFLELEEGLKTGLDIEKEFHAIEERAVSLFGDELSDYLASRGEYLNGKLLACFLGYDFVDPETLIKFDQGGKLEESLTETLLREELLKHKTAVVPGFYGSKPNGRVKTFDRGGSDISGAIVAASSNGDVYENWTDVPGLLMADPGIVEKPVAVPVITYRELREMAYLGATVMHPDAVIPVIGKGIPIRICDTSNPDHPGTLIVKNARYYDSSTEVSGISGKKGHVGVTIQKTALNEDSHARERILNIFGDNQVKIENIMTGIDTITLIGGQDMADKAGELTIMLEKEFKDVQLNWVNDLAVIGIVGREIGNSPNVAIKVLSALGAMHINVRFIDHGTGNMNMTIAVDEGDYENAIKAIYQQFAHN